MNVLTKRPAAPAVSSAATPVTAPLITLPTPCTLAPANFTELVEFAKIAARSQFVPKDYRNHPEDILLAVQLGSEVGLRPMQALQNIAVINGRPAVWGDALPGLCKASHVYEDLIETFEREDDPDFLVAVCTAKRRGSTPVTARFSVIDAKRAGLWTKPGPWQTYPRRMLQMRARSFALRDTFPDVLKGLISVEEALDLPTPTDRLQPTRTIDAAPEPPLPTPTLSPPDDTPTETPVTLPTAETPPDPPADATSDTVYRLQTKQGVTTFRTGDEWLACWAKLVRACKSANALDKLQHARDTNAGHIAAVAAFDPAPVATLTAELDRALAPPSAPL
jgi:hypothetical protein